MNYFIFAFIALVALVGVNAQSPPVWKMCPTSGNGLAVSSVDISLTGRNIAITLDGKVNERVTAGALVIDVTYSGAVIDTENFDLKDSVHLPAGPGAFHFVKTVAIPAVAPAGDYSLAMHYNDQKSTELACIQVNFTLS